jgi:hypothetical protein
MQPTTLRPGRLCTAGLKCHTNESSVTLQKEIKSGCEVNKISIFNIIIPL